MVQSRRRMWGVLVLIVVAPAAFYGLQAVLEGAPHNRSPLPATAAIIPPTAEPRGPTPAVTLAPPLPAPRELDAMAFDAVHNDVLMYGGSEFGNGPETTSRETWSFDAGGWHLLHPGTSPAVVGGWMTEDPVTGRMILVGGPLQTDPPIGTWTWDGTTWTHHGDLPTTTQSLVGLAALPARGQLVLVTAPTGGVPTVDDTWTWEGSAWRLDQPATALPVEGSTPVLVSDPAHRRVVAVFTGNANTRTQTWVWDGSTWSQLAADEVAPFDPISATMATDPRTGDVVLYIGGGDVRVGSTWTLSGSSWSQVNAASPVVDTYYHGSWLLTDTRIGRVLMIGSAGRPNTLNALWVFNGTGWTAERASVLTGPSG
ncbi:MAG TPA: hypothetical protein VND54_06160 [Candidatus Saccharimonadales bacterium]|nr:hypothetical protein [Candidatus Saccharimonadales bacterium]